MKNNSNNGGLFRALPANIRRQLVCLPKSGDGVHRWIYKAAGILGREYKEKLVFRIIQDATIDCGRCVPEREILNAMRDSGRGRRMAESVPVGQVKERAPKLPGRDAELVGKIVRAFPDALAGFRDCSNGDYSIVGTLRSLFYGDPLICIGANLYEMETKSLHEWGSRLEHLQFIVPSPMKARTGISKDGKVSTRCLDNTGARRFLVAEFDQNSIEEQAALHQSLSGKLPLALLVNSGGKSLHGWYFVQGKPESELRLFMHGASRLGADSATWTPCQAVRLPGGRRDNGAVQTIEFFNPGFGGLYR